MTKERTHKIEILRASEKTYDEMVELVSRVVDVDPKNVGLMRVDLTADVKAIPVDWFKRHAYIRFKQTRRELGEVDAYQLVTKGRADTLYGGVKPNQVRIYDKTRERRVQYRRYLRQMDRVNRLMPAEARQSPSSFLALYGHDEDAVITRVERQVHGRHLDRLGLVKMPDLLRTPELDPFDGILLFKNLAPWEKSSRQRALANMTWRNRLVVEALTKRIEEEGISSTLSHLKNLTGPKFFRAKKEFEAFLRITDNVVGIDSARLRDEYRSSTYRQLLRAA